MLTLKPKRLVTFLAAAATAVALTGCSMISSFNEGFVEGFKNSQSDTQGESDVFDLRVGDCILTEGMSDVVTTIPIVPCSEAHDDEAYYAFDITGVDEFPGEDAVQAHADEVCGSEFENFIGIPYEESSIYHWAFYPTEGSWDEGDREVVCLVYDPEQQTVGSLKDSKI